MTQQFPTLHPERLQQVLDYIEQHPESWDQKHWHCGSSHCFCGTAQILSGARPDVSILILDVRRSLGITQYEFNLLANQHNDLARIKEICANIVAAYREGFARDGFDRDGFDRDGFARDGFAREGFAREGFDRYGLNRTNQTREEAQS